MPRARFAEILRLLADHDVEFVVVGMTAGILHGAPVTTAISTASARSTTVAVTKSCSARRWR